jgi:hypothetical protein
MRSFDISRPSVGGEVSFHIKCGNGIRLGVIHEHIGLFLSFAFFVS